MAANSMIVLEQGVSERPPSRPTSGRRSVCKVPFKRTGSSLEMIPPDEDGDNLSSSVDRPPSRPGSRSSLQRTPSLENPRQSLSAGSSGKKSVIGDAVENLMKNEGRSSSADARIERCDSPKKQVFLPSVRRNFEQHGMPKDETLDTILRESMSSPIEQAAYHSNHGNSDQGNKASKENIDALLQRLSMRVEGSKLEGEHRERKGSGKRRPRSIQKSSSTSSIETDAYYITHGTETQSKESPDSIPSKDTVLPSETDAYYISHGAGNDNKESPNSIPSKDIVLPSETDGYYISHGAGNDTEVSLSEPQTKTKDESKESSEDSEDSDEEDEEPKAPIELLGEFVEAVMDEEWEDAEKLCKMVLIYEPENAEAKQFQPLIDEMLKREREKELFGSDSEDESSEEEDSSDEDSEDDDEEEESDEESTTSESESDDDDDDDEERRDKEAEKMKRESKMMKAINATNSGQR